MQDKSLWDDKCNPIRRIFLKTGSQNMENLTQKSIFIGISVQINYIILFFNLNEK
jgi:hypothetical protein